MLDSSSINLEDKEGCNNGNVFCSRRSPMSLLGYLIAIIQVGGLHSCINVILIAYYRYVMYLKSVYVVVLYIKI